MRNILTKRRSARVSSNKNFIQLSNLSKKFIGQDHRVVDDINLTIDKGDLFVIIGPSGSGKTTLLRMIAGFETPTSGSILLDNQDITKLPSYERPINMMFQSYALFPHMNAEQNIAFGLKHEPGICNKEIKKRVEEALSMVNMESFAYRMPDRLSGGQKQRIALARSLVKRPKVLLLDEPLGALDRKTRENMSMELIKIQYLLDTTFIMITHDQDEAMTMADKMAIMESGKILQVGTAEEIYEVPNSRCVAELVGSINTFQGIVVSLRNSKGFIGIEIEETQDAIMIKSKRDIPIGATVWLGIRPEELEIDVKPASKNENQVEAKIIEYGFLGDKTVYHVELLKNNRIIHISVPTSERMRNPEFVTGRRVYVSWYYSDGVVLTE